MDHPTRLSDLGPLWVSESAESRRIRVHQAWFRKEVLGEASWGETRRPGERPLGSILAPRAAAAGLNFTSEAAGRLFEQRHAAGWGIDPVRTTAYLTSSQALTINLLAPLVECPAWAARVFNLLLPQLGEITEVIDFQIEYQAADQFSALGDRTILDALLVLKTSSGVHTAIIETKLGDRFNSRNTPLSPRYGVARELWVGGQLPTTRSTNQLARAHGAGFRAGVAHYGADAATLLLIKPEQNQGDDRAGNAYDKVASPGSFVDTTIENFVSSMMATTPHTEELPAIDLLRTRYTDLSSSEYLWQSVLGRPSLLRAKA